MKDTLGNLVSIDALFCHILAVCTIDNVVQTKISTQSRVQISHMYRYRYSL